MQAVTPTAEDAHGSVMFAGRLGNWGKGLLEEVERTYRDLNAYRKHLDTVIKNYRNQEDDMTVTFKDFQGKL